jgi:DHA2 family multidrug resistance protein
MVCLAAAMWLSTSISPDTSFGWFAWLRVLQVITLPLLFVPINTVAYAGLRPQDTGHASSLINVARNLGGSIGISMATTVLAQRAQFHQSRLVEHIVPTSPNYQQWSARITRHFVEQGYGLFQAKARALGWIGQTVLAQATLLSYIDVFWGAALFAALMVPVTLTLRRVDLARAAPAGH